MIAVNRITYNTYSSKDMDLICDCAFDSDNGEMSTYLTREAIASETYRGDLRRTHGYKYNEGLSLRFTFIDERFGNLSFDRQRRILKWLTSTDKPSFLSVYYDDSDVVAFEVIGAFTEIQTYKIANNRTVGIVATFESVMPYALSIINKREVTSSISFNVETDEPQIPIYPRVTIQQDNTSVVVEIPENLTETDMWLENTVYHSTNTGQYQWIDAQGEKFTSNANTSGFETTSVILTNTYYDNNDNVRAYSSIVTNNLKNEIITLDGANKVVSSNRTAGRIFGDNFNWTWLPLFEGTNNISVTGNCIVTLEWRSPIKIGEW